jgi:hypothetical protein
MPPGSRRAPVTLLAELVGELDDQDAVLRHDPTSMTRPIWL